jgi:chlorobactene glucosyltransferase
MPTWFGLWLALAGGIGLFWLVRYNATRSVVRKRRVLSARSYPGPPEDPPKVSVIVAARDEQDHIEVCVTGLLEQDYPNYELIAVDDRSRDRTPAILQRLERQADGRLRVVTVESLRDGWGGKNNAMHEGVAVSTGEWLLFTDADCRQTSGKTLSMAMREALAYDADFLSVTPRLEAPTVWERIIQPVCALTLMVWFLPHHVNKPKRRTAYANGAFMLLRRSCYDAIGGHERVRNVVSEDIHLARLTKQAGLRLRVVENDDLYSTRMYDSPGAAWRGWSRIFHGCLATLTRLATAALMLLVLSIAPWASLLVAVAGLATSADESAAWYWAVYAWSAVVLLEQFVIWRVYAIMRSGRPWSLTYLLGACVTVCILVSAMLKTAGVTRTTWRGDTYRRHRLTGARP